MVMPNLNHRHIYDVLEPDAELAQMIAAMQVLYPSWQPSETDPLRLAFSVLATRFYLWGEFTNYKARGAFAADAVGSDLDGVCETFGVPRLSGELDEALRRRRDTAVQAVGRGAGYSAYEADALDAAVTIADVKITIDAAPNEGRVIVNLLSTAAASEARADNLLGVPSAAVVAAIQTYLRDPIRVRVGDEDVITRAASPTEYRIAAQITPSTAEAIAAARAAAYAYIDAHRRFDAVLRPSNLNTAMENAAGVVAADLTLFNVAGSTGEATLTATGTTYYDCAKNATGVDLS